MTHPADLFHLFPAGLGHRGRISAIVETLRRSPAVKELRVHDYLPEFTNVYARCGDPGYGAPILSAHHDVVNHESENCLDNTASVCHLLALASDPGFVGYLAFTDAEETTDFSIAGAAFLAEALAVDTDFFGTAAECDAPRTTLVLELTGVGDVIWVDKHASPELLERLGVEQTKRCPFNDATVLRAYTFPAVQVSITPSEQFKQAFPPNWGYCHTLEDRFDLANRDDMARFSDWLRRAATADVRGL